MVLSAKLRLSFQACRTYYFWQQAGLTGTARQIFFSYQMRANDGRDGRIVSTLYGANIINI
jgi:hypothetical protein